MNIPTETSCAICDQWKPVNGWDADLQGFICHGCVEHMFNAGDLLVSAGQLNGSIQPPDEI